MPAVVEFLFVVDASQPASILVHSRDRFDERQILLRLVASGLVVVAPFEAVFVGVA